MLRPHLPLVSHAVDGFGKAPPAIMPRVILANSHPQ